MTKRYFKLNEKIGFFEGLFFEHYIDEDTELIYRAGIRLNSIIAILSMLGIALLAMFN